MKRLLLLACILSWTAPVLGAVSAGDRIFTVSGGVGRVAGANKDLFEAGLGIGSEYLYQRGPRLGLGAGAFLHSPANKSKDLPGSTTRLNISGHYLSLLALARYNLTPAKNHTPWIGAGLGVAQHVFKNIRTPINGGQALETKSDDWKGTASLSLGWDCFAGDFVKGLELRYQYLDKKTAVLGAGLRLGLKF